VGEGDREGNGLSEGVAKETKPGNQTMLASQEVPAGRRQGRKRFEKSKSKETRKDTPTAPP
jgi:hypothetical protein